MLIAPYEAVNEHSTMPKNQSRVNLKDRTHFRLVITTSTNRFQNGWCKSKRLGPGALFRAHWTRVQPLLIDVVPPFADGKDPNYCLQINENFLWEWRTVEGNLKKLYAVLQRNLLLNGYLLEESAFNRVSVLPSTKTKIFVDKIKKENNGKRRGRKKADSVPNRNLSFPPYDILACRRIEKHQWGSLNYLTRPKIKISYSMVRAELSGIERHLFPVIIKSVIFFV